MSTWGEIRTLEELLRNPEWTFQDFLNCILPFLRTCPLYFKQVPGLTVYQKICSGLLWHRKMWQEVGSLRLIKSAGFPEPKWLICQHGKNAHQFPANCDAPVQSISLQITNNNLTFPHNKVEISLVPSLAWFYRKWWPKLWTEHLHKFAQSLHIVGRRTARLLIQCRSNCNPFISKSMLIYESNLN